MRAQPSGITAANPQEKSLLQRVVTVSRETLCRRLLIWTATLAFASLAVEWTWPTTLDAWRQVLTFPIPAIAAAVSLATAFYFAVRFSLTGKLGHALSGAAFWAVACGTILQAVADAHLHSLPGGAITRAAWLTAAVLLIGSGYSRKVLQKTGAIMTACRFVVGGLLSIGLPLVALHWILDADTRAILVNVSARSVMGVSVGTLIAAAAGGALVAALVSHYQRYQIRADRTSWIICYFLIPCAFSMLFQTITTGGMDEWWTVSRLLTLVSWPTLILGLCVEIAVGQSELADRLQELETVHKVSWSVVGARDVHEMLHLFAETMQTTLDAKIVSIYLAGDAPGTLRVAAACGYSGPLAISERQYAAVSEDRRPGFHTGHTAKAYVTGEAQTARDVYVDVELVSWREIGKEDGCALSLPLTDSEGTIGVLALYFSDHKMLTSPRIRLLSTLAASATPAIRSAHARHEAEQSHADDVMDMAA